MAAGDPVISVDTKKKELVGQYHQRRAGSGGPRASRCGSTTTTSPTRSAGKAIPYGIYDLAANTGWVNVGTDHDTAAFAVESIRRWWNGARPGRLPGRRGGC